VMWRGVATAVEEVGKPAGHINDFICVVLVDGRELGRAVTFPLGPVMVNPSTEESQLAFRLIPRRSGQQASASDSVEEQGGSEVVVPFSMLAKYGAPLYTSLWLGVPGVEQTRHLAANSALQKAVYDSRDPEVPKICITMFKPARTPPDPSGSLCGLQPDARSLLTAEAWDDCTGPRLDRGTPKAVQQVEGVLESLKLANATTLALQDRLPSGVRRRTGYCRSAEPFLWRFDAGDEKSIKIRKAPDVNAAPAGASMLPGEVFKVAQEQVGTDGVRYLRLADGRGWLFDTKPGAGTLCHRMQDPPMTMVDLDLSNTDQDIDVSFRGSLLALSRATFPGDPDIAKRKSSSLESKAITTSSVQPSGSIGSEGAALELMRIREELAAVRGELRACQASEAQAQMVLQDQMKAFNSLRQQYDNVLAELRDCQLGSLMARGQPGPADGKAVDGSAADLLDRALHDLQVSRNTPQQGEFSPQQLERLRQELDTWGVTGSAAQTEIDILSQKLVQANEQTDISRGAESNAQALIEEHALEVNRLRQQLTVVSVELERERGRAAPQQPTEGPSAVERELELLQEDLAYYKANEMDVQHVTQELARVQGQLADAYSELQAHQMANTHATSPPADTAQHPFGDSQEEVQALKEQLAAAAVELAAVRSQAPRGQQPNDNQESHDYEVQTLRDELAAAFQEIDRHQVEGAPVQSSDDAEICAEFGAALQELEAYQSNERNALLLQQELEDQLFQTQADLEAWHAKAEHNSQEAHHLREELDLIATEGVGPHYTALQDSFARVQDDLHQTQNENTYLREEVIALSAELENLLGPAAQELQQSEVLPEGQGVADVSAVGTQDVGGIAAPHSGPKPPHTGPLPETGPLAPHHALTAGDD